MQNFTAEMAALGATFLKRQKEQQDNDAQQKQNLAIMSETVRDIWTQCNIPLQHLRYGVLDITISKNGIDIKPTFTPTKKFITDLKAHILSITQYYVNNTASH